MRMCLNYKVSIFGNFIAVQPTTDNMLLLLEELKEYKMVPSIYTETRIEGINVNLNAFPNAVPNTNINANRVQRLSLIDDAAHERVNIGIERLDYDFSFPNGKSLSDDNIAVMNEKVRKVLSVIWKLVGEKGIRLAINTADIIVDISMEEEEAVFHKYANPINLYKNRVLEEWNTRMMVREKKDINSKPETINVITTISKTNIQRSEKQGSIISENGFIVNTDINTIAENAIPRFDVEDVFDFTNYASKQWLEIISEVL